MTAPDPNLATSHSLIQRVQARESGAWARLCDVYSPAVYGWVRKAGVKEDDAVDVVQETFRAVLGGIERFRHDRPDDEFRSWLLTIARNEIRYWHQRLERQLARGEGGADATVSLYLLADWVHSDDDPKSEASSFGRQPKNFTEIAADAHVGEAGCDRARRLAASLESEKERLASEVRQFPSLGLEETGADSAQAHGDTVAGSEVSAQVYPKIPEYEIIGMVGRGGMGVVYKARHVTLQRIVALKMINSAGDADPTYIQRFKAEATIAAQLDHPGIVPVYDVGEDGGRHYFSMAYIEGENLAQLLAEHPLEERHAAELTLAVTEAITVAHSRGLIHRDLKPANILIDSEGRPRITDFGLAKSIRGDSDLTATGQVLGTPSYMPPEQATGDIFQVREAADIYAIGAILYCLLTGRPPFHAANSFDTLRQVIEQEPVAPCRLNARVSRDLETICLKCLEKDAARRYESAAELGEDLARFLRGEPIRARPISWWARAWRWCRRNPVVATSLLLIFLSLVVGGGLATWQWQRAELALDAAQHARQDAEGEREIAKEKREIAEKAQATAELAKERADAASRTAQTILVDMETSRGIAAGEKGDAAAALLWFAEAAKQATSDAERRETNHIRARNAARTATLTVGSFQTENGVSDLRFLSDGELLMTKSATNLTVRDWRIPDQSPVLDVSASAACASADGTVVAVGTADGIVRFHAMPTGKVRHQTKLPARVTAIACGRDSRYWALAAGGNVKIWDAEAAKLLGGVCSASHEVYALTFSPDGRRVAVAAKNDTAFVNEIREGRFGDQTLLGPVKHLHVLPRVGEMKAGPVFADHGRSLVCISSGQELARWSLRKTSKPVPETIELKTHFDVSSLISTPSANLFAAVCHHQLKVFASDKSNSALRFLHDKKILHAAVSGDGSLLFTSSWDGTARLTNFRSGKPIGLRLPHEHHVTVCAISSDRRFLATIGRYGLVRVWRRPEIPSAEATVSNWGECPRLSPDGNLMAPGIWHVDPEVSDAQDISSVRVLTTESGKEAGPLIELPGQLIDSCVCADNRTVAVGWLEGKSGRFGLFDLLTGKAASVAHSLPAIPTSLAANPREPQIAILHRGGLLVLDSVTGKTLFNLPKIKGHRRGHKATYTSNGQALIVLSNQKKIHVLDTKSGSLLCPPLSLESGTDAFRTFALSKDDRWLAAGTGGNQSYVRIWALNEGAPASEPFNLPGGWYAIFAVCFSPDGRYVAAGGASGEIRCWDWRTGAMRCPPMRHRGPINDLKFSPNGFLIASGESGLVFWDTNTGKNMAAPWGRNTAAVPYPPTTSLAITPDSRRLVGAFARDLTASVLHLDRWLEPPRQTVDELRFLGELSTGMRVELGDLSSFTAQQWQERWNELRKTWHWIDPDQDADR